MEVGTIQALRALALGRRHELGLSQAATAARAGVSRKWLSDFESGKETVELGKLLALLEALGVVLHASVGGPDTGREPSASEAVHLDADLDAILADYRAAQ
jgi:HTH-type transcriptional regulator/antitoxin HipB